MPRFIALNCATNYFFSSQLGKMFGIEEAEPSAILNGLISFQKGAIQGISHQIPDLLPYSLAIQVNSREFFFRDEELLQEIESLFMNTQNASRPQDRVHLSIHQGNDKQPLKDKPDFVSELNRNCNLLRKWKCAHLTVHLPIRPHDDIQEVIEVLTQPAVLKIIRGNPGDLPVFIDFENNHHNSFFGDLTHIDAFLMQLDAKLTAIGHSDLIPRFNVCFDFGHYISQATKMGYDKVGMISDFFRTRGNRIGTLHLHVNDGKDDQHFLLSHRPDAAGKIGQKDIDFALLSTHTKILLDTLPLLHLKARDDWIIVTETDTPFTPSQLKEHWEAILRAL